MGASFPPQAVKERCFLVQTLGFFLSFPDFDECTVYGTCSQTCTNTEGSYTCSCVEGYLLQPDNRSCKAKNGESLGRGERGASGQLCSPAPGSPRRARPWGYNHGIQLCPDPLVPSLPAEPVDRPPVLLIANSQNILATYLSGAPVPNITPTSAKQTTAMDFNYVEDTVCWVHVGDSASQTILKCAKIPNLKGFVEERSINISLSLHRECPLPSGPPSCSPIPNSSPPPRCPQATVGEIGKEAASHRARSFPYLLLLFLASLVVSWRADMRERGTGRSGAAACAAGFGMAALASFGPTPKK